MKIIHQKYNGRLSDITKPVNYFTPKVILMIILFSICIAYLI